jgi:hypothetical protein
VSTRAVEAEIYRRENVARGVGSDGGAGCNCQIFLDLENRYEFHRKRKLLELIKNDFRKNQDEEDIGKELQKLQEKRGALFNFEKIIEKLVKSILENDGFSQSSKSLHFNFTFFSL